MMTLLMALLTLLVAVITALAVGGGLVVGSAAMIKLGAPILEALSKALYDMVQAGHARQRRILEHAARSAGLEVGPAVGPRAISAHGDGVWVHLGQETHGSGETQTVHWVVRAAPEPFDAHGERQHDAAPAIPPRLVLRGESFFKLGRDLKVGDPEFDRRVHIGGPPAEGLAWLDAKRRVLIRSWLAQPYSQDRQIRNGEVRASAPKHHGALEALLESTIGLAKALGSASDPVAGLGQNALHDPLPEVRRTNLETLISKVPGAAGDTAREALRDPSPAVRLVAATHLADFDALDALVREADPDLVARAVAALPDDPRLADTLHAAFTHAAPKVDLAALQRAGQADLLVVDGLIAGTLSDLPNQPWKEVEPVVEAALALFEDHGHREGLIALLDAPGSDIRIRALNALAECGVASDGAHIAGLTDAASSKVRAAAEAALARLRDRIDPSLQGAMSLAREAPGGGLSLTDDRGGAVSLPRATEKG